MASGSGPILESFRVHRISAPMPMPYVSGMHDKCDATENVLLELVSGGLIGHGRVFTFVAAQADAIHCLLVGMAESLLGHDVSNVRAVWSTLAATQLRRARAGRYGARCNRYCVMGSTAQRAELPLHQMLGSTTAVLPVYASGGWFTYSKDQLRDEAIEFADLGFVGYKLKVGHSNWREDVVRVEHVLDAVGDRIAIMVDANQSWSVKSAIQAAKALVPDGVNWLEEPVPAEDVSGTARVSSASDLQIAVGESIFSDEGFRDVIERRGADILMPNVVRVGGPSEFVKIASLAETNGLRVSPHLYTEVSAHLTAACRVGGPVEYIPRWWDELFQDAPPIENGAIKLSSRPGLGFTFAEKAIKEWSCSEGSIEKVYVP